VFTDETPALGVSIAANAARTEALVGLVLQEMALLGTALIAANGARTLPGIGEHVGFTELQPLAARHCNHLQT